MNEYFFNLAKRSAELANSYSEGANNIKPEWIYCQWVHESGNFTSELCTQYHNLGGLTQTTPNDTPQPDGDYYYMQFDSYEAYAEYFGRYLRYYAEDGIYNAQSLDDYIAALKHGGYFGDDLNAYLADCKRIYAEEFGQEANA